MNKKSASLTALADKNTCFDVEANSIVNLANAGTPMVIGFSHFNAMEVEETFATVRFCGGLGGPKVYCNASNYNS